MLYSVLVLHKRLKVYVAGVLLSLKPKRDITNT